MRGRIVLLLLIACIIAAGTAYLTLQRLNRPQPQQQAAAAAAQPATQRVLVAVRDLPTGHIVVADDLRLAEWPATALPPGALQQGQVVFGETVVRLPVAMNTPILTTQILSKGKGSSLAYLLDDQRVAKTIPLSVTGGLAGHLMPGDRVDVLLTHELAPSEAGTAVPQQVTETLLIGIKVLATDQRLDDVNSQIVVSNTATLEVSPKEAEMLALAQQVGQLSLALNSAVEPADFDPRRLFEVRRSHIASYTNAAELTLVAQPAPAPIPEAEEAEAPPPAKPRVVIVVRGSEQQELTFEKGSAQPLQQPQESVDPAGQGRGANVAVKLEGAN